MWCMKCEKETNEYVCESYSEGVTAKEYEFGVIELVKPGILIWI